MRLGQLLSQPPFFCGRVSLWAKPQVIRRSQAMPQFGPMSSELSCVCVVLPALAIEQVIRLGWETELARRKRWQVRLQERELKIW
jgi:hypothetical protein